ncbi:MAG TPA: response regulator transcription factor [Pilimelia sp.]|nr:response regulator transcription factor [Pilimelia sp.]
MNLKTSLFQAKDHIIFLGEAEDGREAIQLTERLRPDVVLMDIRMPVLDGLEATRRIAASSSTTKVIMLTTFDLDEYVHDAIRATAAGFLLKDSSARQLVDAIRAAVSGGMVLAPTATKRLMQEYLRSGGPRMPRRDRLRDLTEREIKVLCLVAQGMSNAEIAAHLVIAEQTVKTHVSRILMKMGLRDRTQAAVLAYESGLVVPGS